MYNNLDYNELVLIASRVHFRNVNMNSEDSRTVYCGNLSEEISEKILYELFIQAGPIESIRRPKNENGEPKPFAFILYKHDVAVPYALEMFRDTKLFNRHLRLNSRSKLHHIPVFGSVYTDYSQNSENYQERDRGYHSDKRSRTVSNNRHQHSNNERGPNGPKSWAEFNALKGQGLPSNSHNQHNLQRESIRESGSERILPGLPDFSALLQMGQQMMFPGVMGQPGMFPGSSAEMLNNPGVMALVGLGASLGSNMLPSMRGRYSGGERNSPERNVGHSHSDRHRGRTNNHEDGRNRRDHPYSDRREGRRLHDSGYSSSCSSHGRERRERRSR